MDYKTKITIRILLIIAGICFFIVDQERKKLKEIIQDCSICTKEFMDRE